MSQIFLPQQVTAARAWEKSYSSLVEQTPDLEGDQIKQSSQSKGMATFSIKLQQTG